MEVHVLFARLQDAKLEVEFANAYLKEIQHDSNEGAVESDVARCARQRAQERQRTAVEQYMDVLEKFLAENGSESRRQMADYV